MSTSRDNSQLFEFFLSTLETHQNLLHAETQAIAAKHLDTIESILAKKEESLALLLEARDNIGFDPRSNSEANELIDQVIELQKKKRAITQKTNGLPICKTRKRRIVIP